MISSYRACIQRIIMYSVSTLKALGANAFFILAVKSLYLLCIKMLNNKKKQKRGTNSRESLSTKHSCKHGKTCLESLHQISTQSEEQNFSPLLGASVPSSQCKPLFCVSVHFSCSPFCCQSNRRLGLDVTSNYVLNQDC